EQPASRAKRCVALCVDRRCADQYRPQPRLRVLHASLQPFARAARLAECPASLDVRFVSASSRRAWRAAGCSGPRQERGEFPSQTCAVAFTLASGTVRSCRRGCMKSVLAVFLFAAAANAAALPGFRVEMIGSTAGFCSSLAVDSKNTIYYTTTKGGIFRLVDG